MTIFLILSFIAVLGTVVISCLMWGVFELLKIVLTKFWGLNKKTSRIANWFYKRNARLGTKIFSAVYFEIFILFGLYEILDTYSWDTLRELGIYTFRLGFIILLIPLTVVVFPFIAQKINQFKIWQMIYWNFVGGITLLGGVFLRYQSSRLASFGITAKFYDYLLMNRYVNNTNLFMNLMEYHVLLMTVGAALLIFTSFYMLVNLSTSIYVDQQKS